MVLNSKLQSLVHCDICSGGRSEELPLGVISSDLTAALEYQLCSRGVASLPLILLHVLRCCRTHLSLHLIKKVASHIWELFQH
jgi:hypothetical protein